MHGNVGRSGRNIGDDRIMEEVRRNLTQPGTNTKGSRQGIKLRSRKFGNVATGVFIIFLLLFWLLFFYF